MTGTCQFVNDPGDESTSRNLSSRCKKSVFRGVELTRFQIDDGLLTAAFRKPPPSPEADLSESVPLCESSMPWKCIFRNA